MIEHALAALALGAHIFPVEPGAKTPIRIYQDRPAEDAPWTIKWSEVATNDVNKVCEWWTYAPNANVGIACKPSGLFVVDCDRPKTDNLLRDTPWAELHDLFGPRVDGEVAFDYIAQKKTTGPEGVAQALDTFTVTTGSGGRHFYYRWPDETHSSQDSIVKGLIDVRGNGGQRGGYVLGPGSVTEKGTYTRDPGCRNRPRFVPEWLRDMCTYREPPRQPRRFDQARAGGSFGGLVETVRRALDGNLNNSLLWASRAACSDGMAEAECIELLAPVYVELGGRGGYRQAEATIRSAYRLQKGKG